jgi:hydroxymethylpyrimidine/phosphomethylpyrimidine kinase
MTVPVVLTIAGSDSSGGAGIQQDTSVCNALGSHCATAVTAVTAQGENGVSHLEWVSPAAVTQQIQAAFDTFHVGAVKIGLLGTPRLIEAVSAVLSRQVRRPPVIVDPVIASSSGTPFWVAGSLEALTTSLLPITTLLTPNLPEAAVLAGCPIDTPSALQPWAAVQSFATLLKGGHGQQQTLEDWLFQQDSTVKWRHVRLEGSPVRGTGCALSTAIATGLAQDKPLIEAVDTAIGWLQKQLLNARDIGGLCCLRFR